MAIRFIARAVGRTIPVGNVSYRYATGSTVSEPAAVRPDPLKNYVQQASKFGELLAVLSAVAAVMYSASVFTSTVDRMEENQVGLSQKLKEIENKLESIDRKMEGNMKDFDRKFEGNMKDLERTIEGKFDNLEKLVREGFKGMESSMFETKSK